MIYIGIDPGLSGGIAALTDNGLVIDVRKMPATEKDLLEAIQFFADRESVEGPAFAMIEKVGVMPKQGIVSAFTFGRGVGALLMALTATEIGFDQVLPSTWQQAIGCLSRGDKNVTKRRAQQLFPREKVTHAIADALLIAEFCRRTRRGIHGKEEKRAAQVHPEAGAGSARARKGSKQGQRRGEEISAAEARTRSAVPNLTRNGAGARPATR